MADTEGMLFWNRMLLTWAMTDGIIILVLSILQPHIWVDNGKWASNPFLRSQAPLSLECMSPGFYEQEPETRSINCSESNNHRLWHRWRPSIILYPEYSDCSGYFNYSTLVHTSEQVSLQRCVSPCIQNTTSMPKKKRKFRWEQCNGHADWFLDVGVTNQKARKIRLPGKQSWTSIFEVSNAFGNKLNYMLFLWHISVSPSCV